MRTKKNINQSKQLLFLRTTVLLCLSSVISISAYPAHAQTSSSKSERSILETGDSVEATPDRSIAWTSSSVTDLKGQKYLFRLKKAWENNLEEEIFPKGTVVIAEISSVDVSGNLRMNVILIRTENHKISVPENTIVVSGKDGSPLIAKLVQTDNNSVARDANTVAGTGIQAILDRQTTNLRVRNGVDQVLNRRLNNTRSVSSSSYFELKQGTTVELIVNEDFNIFNLD